MNIKRLLLVFTPILLIQSNISYSQKSNNFIPLTAYKELAKFNSKVNVYVDGNKYNKEYLDLYADENGDIQIPKIEFKNKKTEITTLEKNGEVPGIFTVVPANEKDSIVDVDGSGLKVETISENNEYYATNIVTGKIHIDKYKEIRLVNTRTYESEEEKAKGEITLRLHLKVDAVSDVSFNTDISKSLDKTFFFNVGLGTNAYGNIGYNYMFNKNASLGVFGEYEKSEANNYSLGLGARAYGTKEFVRYRATVNGNNLFHSFDGFFSYSHKFKLDKNISIVPEGSIYLTTILPTKMKDDFKLNYSFATLASFSPSIMYEGENNLTVHTTPRIGIKYLLQQAEKEGKKYDTSLKILSVGLNSGIEKKFKNGTTISGAFDIEFNNAITPIYTGTFGMGYNK